MKHRRLLALLASAVVCAGVGVALLGNPFAPVRFGWTAYAPLSGAVYRPFDPTWLTWAPRVGVVLLSIGAGTAGAAVAALVLLRAGRRHSGPPARGPE